MVNGKVDRADIVRVLKQYKLLHNGGHGVTTEMRKQGADGQQWDRLAEQRIILLSAESIARVQSAHDWAAANLRKGLSMNRRHTSYGLKHVMEASTGVYVSNGEFIIAMCLAGFDMDHRHYNPHFNVVTNDIKAATKRGRVTA